MPHMITQSNMQIPADAVVEAAGPFTKVPPRPYMKADGSRGNSKPALAVKPGSVVDTDKIEKKALSKMLDKAFPALVGMNSFHDGSSPADQIRLDSMPKTQVYSPSMGAKIETQETTDKPTKRSSKTRRSK